VTAAAKHKRVGRYILGPEIAAGGMASVHLGRLEGPVGFARTVAIKRLHEHFAKDPDFVSMFMDEARLASRIRHPNVVSVADVVTENDEIFLVMEFVIGESISRLMKLFAKGGIPVRHVLAIVSGTLQGLHAAHETRGDDGTMLNIVHRDVSPQNVLLGSDGVARLIDFGVAKAVGRMQASMVGQLKGKLPYMAPEQVQGQATRQSDVFAAGVVAWELLTGHRLFLGENEAATFHKVLQGRIPKPSDIRPWPWPKDMSASQVQAIDAIILRALSRDMSERFATARDFAVALDKIAASSSALEVSDWLTETIPDVIREQERRAAEGETLITGTQTKGIPAPKEPSAKWSGAAEAEKSEPSAKRTRPPTAAPPKRPTMPPKAPPKAPPKPPERRISTPPTGILVREEPVAAASNDRLRGRATSSQTPAPNLVNNTPIGDDIDYDADASFDGAVTVSANEVSNEPKLAEVLSALRTHQTKDEARPLAPNSFDRENASSRPAPPPVPARSPTPQPPAISNAPASGATAGSLANTPAPPAFSPISSAGSAPSFAPAGNIAHDPGTSMSHVKPADLSRATFVVRPPSRPAWLIPALAASGLVVLGLIGLIAVLIVNNPTPKTIGSGTSMSTGEAKPTPPESRSTGTAQSDPTGNVSALPSGSVTTAVTTPATALTATGATTSSAKLPGKLPGGGGGNPNKLPPKPKVNCTPPSYVGDDGKIHFKPECFGK
jgi:eukaryotic-like serine/threonine-protein kinase